MAPVSLFETTEVVYIRLAIPSSSGSQVLMLIPPLFAQHIMYKSTLAIFLAACLPFGHAIDPAAAIVFHESTTCTDGGIGITVPDGTCFSIVADGLLIDAIDDQCFGKFDSMNYLGKL